MDQASTKTYTDTEEDGKVISDPAQNFLMLLLSTVLFAVAVILIYNNSDSDSS